MKEGAPEEKQGFFEKHAKKLTAAAALALGVAAYQGTEHDTSVPEGVVAEQSANPSGALEMKRQIEDINRQQQQLLIDNERIEREKAMIIEPYVSGKDATKFKHDTRRIVIEGKYQSNKARIAVRNFELEAEFAAKSDLTKIDVARYLVRRAEIDADAIRIEVQLEEELAGESKLREIRGERMGDSVLNMNADIQRMETEQRRINSEIQRLSQEKIKMIIRGIQA